MLKRLICIVITLLVASSYFALCEDFSDLPASFYENEDKYDEAFFQSRITKQCMQLYIQFCDIENHLYLSLQNDNYKYSIESYELYGLMKVLRDYIELFFNDFKDDDELLYIINMRSNHTIYRLTTINLDYVMNHNEYTKEMIDVIRNDINENYNFLIDPSTDSHYQK